MAFGRLRELLTLSFVLCLAGCRPEAPSSFTPGPEVEELTADLEDEEEIRLFSDLQTQIAVKLTDLTGTPNKMKLLGADESTDQLQQGYRVYSTFCTQCHGVTGDGRGPVAEYLSPKPRNYTLGVFKFTSTPYGSKPRRSDLMRTVRQGVTGTSMPSFDRLSEEDLGAVVDYVLALTYRGELERQLALFAFDEEQLPDDEYLAEMIDEVLALWRDASEEIVMPVTPMPPMTDQTVKLGHQIFLSKACNKCHGTYGRGGSMGDVDVGTDVWGYEAAAADLSSGMFRGGGRPIDLYRRIYSGINGTPMPGFKDTFSDDPDSIWRLVHFIKETGERRRRGLPPLGEADLPVDPPAGEAAAESEPDESAEEREESIEATPAGSESA